MAGSAPTFDAAVKSSLSCTGLSDYVSQSSAQTEWSHMYKNKNFLTKDGPENSYHGDVCMSLNWKHIEFLIGGHTHYICAESFDF